MKIPTLQKVYDQNTTEAVTNDYPYGRLRCTAKWWIEERPKMGARVMFQTINPKTGRVNAPKKGNYWPVVVLVKNPENGHIENFSVSNYDSIEELAKFRDTYQLREKDEKFIDAWIVAKKRFAEKVQVKYTITEKPPVNIFEM